MPVTASLYGKFLGNILGGMTAGETRTCDIQSDSIKIMLCTSSYVPDKDAHAFKSDVTNEVTGAGYSAGGIALTTKTLAYSSVFDTITFDADDAVWSNAAITARIAVVYDDTPTLAVDKPLIGYIDFGQDRQSFQPGSFTVAFSTSGIFTLQAV